MNGYFEKESSGKGLAVPTGRLHIEVTNLQEFQELINRAKSEADQLQKTINRLNGFELNIDFSTKQSVIEES